VTPWKGKLLHRKKIAAMNRLTLTLEANCDFCLAGYCPEMTAITPIFRHIQNLQGMLSRRRWIVKSSATRANAHKKRSA
jgi:hypothetical protein